MVDFKNLEEESEQKGEQKAKDMLDKRIDNNQQQGQTDQPDPSAGQPSS